MNKNKPNPTNIITVTKLYCFSLFASKLEMETSAIAELHLNIFGNFLLRNNDKKKTELRQGCYFKSVDISFGDVNIQAYLGPF